MLKVGFFNVQATIKHFIIFFFFMLTQGCPVAVQSLFNQQIKIQYLYEKYYSFKFFGIFDLT